MKTKDKEGDRRKQKTVKKTEEDCEKSRRKPKTLKEIKENRRR